MDGLSHKVYAGLPQPAPPDSGGESGSRQWNGGVRLEALANLAHELRHPVQALLGYLEILRDDWDESIPASHRRVLGRMNVNAHELALTVENVMDFAAAGAGAADGGDEEIRVRDLIAEILPAIEAANESKGLRIRFELETAPAAFRALRRPIKSTLLNLAVNAIKFTDRGSVTIAIRRARAGFGSAIEIEVSDTGPGIEASKVARAFEQGAQLSAASIRTHRGMGLGLAVVRRNAGRLGARLFVRTMPGRGSAFRLVIPIKFAAAGQDDRRTPRRSPLSGSGASGRPPRRESKAPPRLPRSAA